MENVAGIPQLIFQYERLCRARNADLVAIATTRSHEDDPVAARRRLNRLVAKGRLRPALIGGRRRYAIAELRRFVEKQVEIYGEVL